MTLPPPGPAPQAASNQAITALILGILSLACCPLLGPIALYLGFQELKAVRAMGFPSSGETLAVIAIVLGVLGTISLAIFLLWILFFGGLAFFSALGAGMGAG